MEKLMKLWGLIAAQLALPAEDRDEKALQKHMHDYGTLVSSDEMKDVTGAGDVTSLKASVEQLKKDLAAETEARRNIERMGLGMRQNRIIVPGREARREMIADGRCFMDDEQAKRFGAHVAVRLARTSPKFGVDDLPKRTREINDDVEKAALPDITSASGTGAELMSNEFRSELIRTVETYGTVYVEAGRRPLATFGTTYWPKGTGRLTGYWTTPAAAITQSGLTFETVEMSPEGLKTLTGIPNEMMQDPGLLVDLGNLVGLEIAYAMAYALDNAIINGDGTASMGGITGILQSATLTAVTPSAHTTVATLDGDDLDDFLAGLTLSTMHVNAQWFLSLSVLMKLLAIKDATTKQYIYREADVRGKRVLDGYPAVVGQLFTAAASGTADVNFGAFGDLRRSHYVGMIRNIQIATSEHVWFDQDMTAIRGILHCDMAEADANALVVLHTHA